MLTVSVEEAGGGGRAGAACVLPRGAALKRPPLPPTALRQQTGQAWASLGEPESADALLGCGLEHGAALRALALEGAGWRPQQAQAASLLLGLLLGRLGTALALGQQVGCGGWQGGCGCCTKRVCEGRHTHMRTPPHTHPHTRCWRGGWRPKPAS